ncbi:MAG: ANTAR domain-containing protein [Propionibacteriaceae bacterium]
MNEDEAFTILTHASQRTNTKLRDVAAELVRTGTLPGEVNGAARKRLTTSTSAPESDEPAQP